MVSGCMGVNAGEVYAKLVVGGGECSGDAGGVWNDSSSSPICSARERGGGVSVMRSARLSEGLLEGDETVVARLRGVLGGSGMYSSMKGDEMVVVKVLWPYCQPRSVGTAGGPHDHLLPARRQRRHPITKGTQRSLP